MAVHVYSVERPEVAPFSASDRLRSQIVYFMTPAGEPGVPPLQPLEYWIRLDDARRWLDDGVLEVVSPLTTETKAEVELSEEQEAWLEWLVANGIQHVRLAG